MIAKDTLNMKSFPSVVQSDCRNIRRIYPLKQRQVDKIYSTVKHDAIVKKVIVFGSSVTGKCRKDSDLDICIDADSSNGMKIYELQRQIGDICDWNCDILMWGNLGERLKGEILREGVVIYEQLACESESESGH